MSEGKKKPEQIIVDNPDGSKTVHFKDHPLMIDGTEVKSVDMREPLVDDQLAVDHIQSAGRSEVTIIANLCELPPETVGSLKMRQYGRLQDAYRAFMS
ncbi:phage tail assembly protein [Ascidiaceihabitans sp.]|uniref:phage tail assembly protein n=1 Tax=Ascidiaceihabitans sp. TaxID=1872644 RepID=UPI00329870FC